MPKLKTNRGAAKRFRATANGYKSRSAKTRHGLTCRNRKIKRHARNGLMVDDTDKGRLDQMLPFAK